MIESGWPAARLAGQSPAQLIWIQSQKKAREIKSEIRQLMNLAAAVNTGTNGGDAARDRLRDLQAELKQLATGEKEPKTEPKSRTPRSQAEFEQMMSDANK